jgi:hypothetical protein
MWRIGHQGSVSALNGSEKYHTRGWLAIIRPTHVEPERCDPVTRMPRFLVPGMASLRLPLADALRRARCTDPTALIATSLAE